MNFSNRSHSRRGFIQLGAALGATAALARTRLFADDAAPAGAPNLGGLPFGVQSYTLRDRSFDKALDAIVNDLKLKYVEIWPNHVAGKSPADIKKMLDDHGVTATGWGVVGFSKNVDDCRKKFDLAKALGVPHVTCDPDPDSFDALDKLTEEYGITADIHDHGPGHRWGKIDVIWQAIKDHSKNVGLCNDTGHFIRNGEDPLRACEVFGDRVHAMHVKDFKKEGNGWADCGLGEGGLNLEALMKWALDRKFKGDMSLEYEGAKPVEICTADMGRVEKAIASAKKA